MMAMMIEFTDLSPECDGISRTGFSFQGSSSQFEWGVFFLSVKLLVVMWANEAFFEMSVNRKVFGLFLARMFFAGKSLTEILFA
jgi:hypothetical protein